MSNNKISYIEKLSHGRTFLMGLAMISIMLFHQVWVKDLVMHGFRFCGNMGVDIFFFVSGFGIAFSLDKHTTKEFYKRRLLRLMPLCFFVGIIKYIWSWFDPDLSSHLGWRIIIGFDLWFIEALIIFYIVSPLLYSLIQRWGGLKILLVAFVIGLVIGPTYQFGATVNWGAVRFPAYVLGMLVSMDKVRPHGSYLKWGVVFLFIAMGYRALQVFGIVPVPESYTYLILCLGIISLCYWLSSLQKPFAVCHLDKPVLWIGKHSLELYLWHEFIYDFIWGFQLNSSLSLLLAISLSVVLAFVSYKVIDLVQLTLRAK